MPSTYKNNPIAALRDIIATLRAAARILREAETARDLLVAERRERARQTMISKATHRLGLERSDLEALAFMVEPYGSTSGLVFRLVGPGISIRGTGNGFGAVHTFSPDNSFGSGKGALASCLTDGNRDAQIPADREGASA